tara:strand:+ start:1552 stop:2055 length:504 start_codon:yes stop_codon:yes gene_type:complete
MAKFSKNLQHVQDMLDGKYQRKVQTGYTPSDDKHEVGDIWTDSDDKTWEQKKGYRVRITKLANSGIAEECSDCGKFIIKKWDKDVYFWNGRCYYCQINFEAELRGTGKYDEWLKAKTDKFKEDWIERFEKDNADFLKELEELENPFDTKVAGAMSNENVSMTIKKNT